jgi:GT2 family glycosyltransferase
VPTLSVVIPTFQRPDWLGRAVASLAAQTRPPEEVIAVARESDAPTGRAISDLAASALPFALRRGEVREPGFMPPVRAGFAVACGEVVAVMDDDAEALPDFAERLLRHYDDPAVGGVGGRYINMDGEKEREEGTTDRVGYVGLKVIGDMYKRPTFREPRDVEFLLGGCMSYRHEVAKRLEFDLLLNQSVAFGYEVDLGLQVRRLGLRLVFDPAIAVRHYSAPRAEDGMRRIDDRQAVRSASFNEARIVLRRLPWTRSAPYLVYSLAVGVRRAPGLGPLLLWPLARRLGFEVALAPAALAGRLRAAAGVLRRR